MHIDLTQSSPERTKKSKASKRLRFDEPGEEFIFKPRRLVTRKQVREAEKVHKGEKVVKMPRTEVIEEFSKTEEAVKHKDKNKKVIITQGDNIIAIKYQAGTTEDEVAKANNVTRELAVRYACP